MQYLNIKNKKKRFFYKKKEKKTYIYKVIQNNFNFGQLLQIKAFNLLLFFTTITPFYSTAFVKRCIISKRKKIVNNIIYVSRLVFLDFARSGEFYGIKKAVW